MSKPHRRATDTLPFRLLIGTVVLCTFLILGVLAFAIVNTNTRIDDSIDVVEQGITCLLGNIAGTEQNIDRPPEDEVATACAFFLEELDVDR